MKIRRLSIRRMPGFEEQGFDLEELSEGLNLIIGPNASGKTTACRAIQGLLWPETLSKVSPVSLLGEWVDGDHVLRLEMEGSQLTCQRDGVPAELPPLPGSHLANCFTVTIDDLFAGSETDEGLAEQIAREMAGGYDLNAIRQLDQLKLSRRHGREELKAFQTARQEAQAIEAQQEKLRSDEVELDHLEEQELEARNAQARLQRLRDVRQLITVRSKIREAQTVVAGLPPGMDLLRGNEAERLGQLRADLDENIRSLKEESAKVEKAGRQIAQANLPEEGIPQLRLEEQNTRLENLNNAERDLRNEEGRLREAEQKAEAALRVLSHVGSPEKLDDLDLTGLDEIEAFHRDTEDLQSRRSAAEAQLAALGRQEPPGDVDSMASGIGILREWFEARSAQPPTEDKNLVLVWALAALIAVVGIVLSVLVSPWWSLLLVPAATGALASRFWAKPVSVDLRRMCQDRFGRLPLEPPDAWDPKTVGEYLNGLERALAQARQAEQHEVERRSFRRQLDQLEEKTAGLTSRRAELIQRFGVAPDTSNLALSVLATNLRAYREARTVCRTCGGEVARLRQSRAEQLQAINALLTEFGQEPCDSHEIARVRSGAIAQRANLHREARSQLAAAEKNAAAAQDRIDTLRERKRQLFADAALDEDDDGELENRLGLMEEYTRAVKRRNDLEAQQAGLLGRLEDVPELLNLAIEQVEAETTRLKTMAEGYKGLVAEIADIRSRVDRAGRETRLEEAVVRVGQAKDRLIERREEALLAAAGNFLLDQVETEHQVESQPHVLRRAVAWFGLFTRGRYELRIADATQTGSPAFHALETTSGRGLALDELSRGTRMQLLLAVRLAFAAAAERGTRLPLVLDEVLSSSDPVRFRAIIECLLALVNDGRQVFYFTCQPGDAAAWQEVAQQMGIAHARRLDLAEVQRLESAPAAPLSEPTIRVERVPEPGSMTLSQYTGLLGVPALDPAAGARAAHVAHFVENPRQLHRLLQASIEIFGQLRSLASHGDVDAYIDSDVLARIKARASVLDAFAEAWSVGRGRPLSREVLLAAGVSESYIDRVADLARGLDFDAKRLLEALAAREDERAKGFRSNTLETVRESLTESEHFDPRETLDEQTVLGRVLAAANQVVKSGLMDAAEVRRLCARFWRKCVTCEQQ